MRILLSLAVVFGTMAALSTTSEAQMQNNGYEWGVGVGQGLHQGHIPHRIGRRGFRGGIVGGFGTRRFEDIPHFAKFPPVYYSGIVKRPYGISPFAAPPGIAPVEMLFPQPVTIQNPFFENEMAPVSNEQPAESVVEDNDGNKVTWRANPYIESVVTRN